MKYSTKAIGLSILTAFTLSACEDAMTGPNANTVKGVGIGAATGAIAGAILGDDTKAIILGTAAGAAVGGLIGYALDKQEAALRESLSGQGATIENTGSELIVTLQDDITFHTDSTYVRNDFRPELYKIATNLQQFPDTTVDVVGHADNTGDAGYNQALSADRARAVSNILRQRGVSGSRITSYGRGETAPIASNDTEDGKAQNRRVEIIIRPAA